LSSSSNTTPFSESAAPKRALVVGASSGMGEELVRRLAADGWSVAALARREGPLLELKANATRGAVHVHAHDVTDTAAIAPLFETIVREMGGIDLFIFAAGVMPEVGAEEYNTEKDFLQFAVNLGGFVAWANEVALYMQSARAGTIVGISSIAGDRGRKPNPAYHTSKAAMSTFLESLRNRLSAYDVHVCTIKPGTVLTPMTEGLEGLKWPISVEAAVSDILRAIEKKKNTAYVPFRWQLVSLVIQHIPSMVFRKLNF
jgi:NAD(P)-dependent dehydrogenase (short-subunit alcohol dehydrogenase family)